MNMYLIFWAGYINKIMNEEYNMNFYDLVTKIATAAQAAKDDSESNRLARLATRLSHYKAPYEPDLTPDEIKQIKAFI